MYAFLLGTITIVLVFFYYQKNDQQGEFSFYASVMMLLFFAMPFALISNSESIVYAGSRITISENEILSIFTLYIIFVLGFVVTDGQIRLRLRKNNNRLGTGSSKLTRSAGLRLSGQAMLVALICTLAFLYGTNYATTASQVRTGGAQGSHLMTLFMSFCIVTSIFFLSEAHSQRQRILTTLWLITFFLLALQVGGRTTLLLSAVYVAVIFNVPVKKAALLAILCLPIILPIIRDGKTIIYYLSTGHSLAEYEPSINLQYLDFLTSYHDSIISNFGHPVVSMIHAPSLAGEIGYRFFYDYLHGIIFYLRTFGIETGDSLTYFNTEKILGIRESIIPTGYLAFGYLQLNFIGVFISGVFYRLIGYFAFKFMMMERIDSTIVKLYITLISSYTFYTGEIRTMMITFFFQIIVARLYVTLLFKPEPSPTRRIRRIGSR